MDIRNLTAERITRENFAEFGLVLSNDDDDPSLRVRARYTNGQEPMPSIIMEVNPDGVLRSGWAARHRHQTQAFTPVDGPVVFVLAPAEVELDSPDALAHFRAFVADVGEGAQIREGTWHWAASVRRGAVRVGNLQGHDWPNDNEIVNFDERFGVQFGVRHPWIERGWADELAAVGVATLESLGAARVDTQARGITHHAVAGRVVEVQANGGRSAVIDAIDGAPEGAVLLVRPDFLEAAWTPVMSLAAARRRLGGAVIEGSAHGARALEDIGFPVAARAVVDEIAPDTGSGSVSELGDWLVVDHGGAALIPDADIESIVPQVGAQLAAAPAALPVDASEHAIAEALVNGASLRDAIRVASRDASIGR